ncbi:MAG: anthranilate phosphoribosyltransferase [Chthoniobacterales bacterium]
MSDFKKQFTQGKNLDSETLPQFVNFLLDEKIPIPQRADALDAFHQKKETSEEIAALVKHFLNLAIHPHFTPADIHGPTIDVCGTGGDGAGLFNVSTAVTFVLAAAGLSVLKHGNRSITSKSGGADTLEALGIPTEIPTAQAPDFLRHTGFIFLFAPQYHPAFKTVAPVRKYLATQGKRSVFNILGPLLNPAHPDYQLAGVCDPAILPTYAQVLKHLNRKAAWIVCGKLANGLSIDEISITSTTQIQKLSNAQIHPTEQLDPATTLSLNSVNEDALRGGTAQENATLVEQILRGKDHTTRRDMVAVNAAAALCLTEREPSLRQAYQKITQLLDSGAAGKVLDRARNWHPPATDS